MNAIKKFKKLSPVKKSILFSAFVHLLLIVLLSVNLDHKPVKPQAVPTMAPPVKVTTYKKQDVQSVIESFKKQDEALIAREKQMKERREQEERKLAALKKESSRLDKLTKKKKQTIQDINNKTQKERNKLKDLEKKRKALEKKK